MPILPYEQGKTVTNLLFWGRKTIYLFISIAGMIKVVISCFVLRSMKYRTIVSNIL